MTHKPIAISVIIPIAVAAILIVPWAPLQRSHAQSDIASTILDIHNRERAAVSVPPLVWSDKLAADAKSWAEHLVKLNEGKLLDELTSQDLVHSTGTGQGENLHNSWWTGSGEPSTAEMVQGWVDEKKNWNGGTYPSGCASGKVCGHYTQMVWKDTKDVGCATASASGSVSAKYGGGAGHVVYLVCRYSPPGNYRGETPY
jgi:pathogenesis-related protein 1